MKLAYSGPQTIFLSRTKENPEVGEGACRICGGPLLLPAKDALSRSEKWTDENLCRRKDSPNVCRACSWFSESNNRMAFWEKMPAVFAAPGEYKAGSIADLYKILQSDFQTPCVFLIRGTDPKLAQKHLQWRTISAVTYSRQKTRVVFSGLQLFKLTKISGVAEFDADDFVANVTQMIEVSDRYLYPVVKHIKSAWAQKNNIFQHLLKAFAGEKEKYTGHMAQNHINNELYLAAYFASNIFIEEKQKGDRDA